MPSDSENENINPQAEEDRDDAPPTGLDEGAKAVFAKEREARKQAAREARELKAELDALKAAKAADDAAKAAADEEAAIKRGEFEQIANERGATITTLTGERDGYKAQLDTLIAAIKPDVDAAWKAVPDEIKSFYDGADDDVLAKRAFLAKSKPAIDKLTAQQDEKNEAFKRFPRTPQPNGNGRTADDDKARKAQGRTVSTI